MKRFFVVVILATFLGILSQIQGQWRPHTIDSNLPHATFIDIADIDGDGDLDMAANGSPFVRWYQNNLPDTIWPINDIDNSLYGAVGLAIVDIDGDDTLDVVAAGYNSNDIRWYKNEGGTPIYWRQYIIDDYFYGAEGLIVGDIDADGDPDVVVTGTIVDQLAWFENKLPDTNWKKHIIDDDLPGANGVDVGDIDGDDDLDVVVTGLYANDVRWYENNLPDTIWNPITIVGNLSGAFFARIADIDGDNTLDVVATGQSANKLVWCKNENAGQTWTEYPIDVNLDGARIINVADIDGDDTPDVVATAYDAGEVVWYKNQHPNWPQHKIDTDLETANYVCTADINGDGLLDVVATGRESGKLNWYEQERVWVKTCEVFPKYLIPAGDSLLIRAHIVIRENHSISVDAKIHGETVPFSDSLLLYDDGLHFDENPNDNIWGNAKWFSGLEADNYIIDLSIKDITTDITTLLHQASAFTTIGPLVLENRTPVADSLAPNESSFFNLKIWNQSASDTACNISASIASKDSCVFIVQYLSTFGDIAPGAVSTSENKYGLLIHPNCNSSRQAKIDLLIFSEGYLFWQDSFIVDLVTNLKPQMYLIPNSFELKQNFPNPFNPVTMINYQLPMTSEVDLSIYNLLGQKVATLVNERKRAGHHQVEWDASGFASGIYLYRLETEGYVETRKMVVMR
jgi:hypothetical protein